MMVFERVYRTYIPVNKTLSSTYCYVVVLTIRSTDHFTHHSNAKFLAENEFQKLHLFYKKNWLSQGGLSFLGNILAVLMMMF